MKSLGTWLTQLITSIYSRKQSTRKVEPAKPRKINHEWVEEELNKAYNFMVGEHLYALDFGYVHGFIHPWHWTLDGDLCRRMTGHYWITTKTRKFQESVFSQVMIAKKDIPIDHRQMASLMEDKTYNMEMSFTSLLEDSIGKDKRFRWRRGRFTVLKIENVNDEG